MKALSAALTTVHRDSPLAGGPLGMSHITPPSGTGQFIEPVMSTMKYRSTGVGSPSAEVDVHAEFGSTEPAPPLLPVLAPFPVLMLPLPAVLPVLPVLMLPFAAEPPLTLDSSPLEPQASATNVPNRIG